ncbi:MAG: PAS domain-containing protein [Desulfomonile sp.]|nr:PAS domain-containing protein [Desulfomonile sp.]
MQDLTTGQSEKILDSLPCYVTLLDRHLEVLWTNDVSRHDFGDPSGKTCFELYRIRGGKCPECLVEKSFQDGRVHNKEMTLTTVEGTRIDVLVYSSPVRSAEGEIVSVVETAVNITSVKEIQKQLILLGQTVAGMAHSIKNIMMGLDGGIYVVKKGLEAKNQDEVREGWEMVLLNFDKISHIVKDILYCSKEREPDLQVIDPNTVAREVYDLFKDLAASYSIELKLELDPELESAVIDPSGLHSVLSNLVSNAMDACKLDMAKDEHLVEIRSKKGKDGGAIFEVADNGIGIDKNVKGHVFEDFFTSKGDKGTGLGLMVTQKILREHGGSITFRSRPGRGTTFVATFPKKDLPRTT